MKCLPAATVPLAKGNILHDWHAEILAIRSFNYFLLLECAQMTKGPQKSPWVQRRETHEMSGTSRQPFAIKDDVQIHMYCSEAPCGDASMELVMDAQEVSTPWLAPPKDDTSTSASLLGRGHFSQWELCGVNLVGAPYKKESLKPICSHARSAWRRAFMLEQVMH